MVHYLMLPVGFFLIYWSGKTRNRLTKFAGLMLAVSILMQFVGYMGIKGYAPYFFSFFTLFAGFEPSGSFKFKPNHKAFFAYMGIASAVYSALNLVNLPFEIYAEFFLIPAPFVCYRLWVNSKRVVYQRAGFLLAWSTQTIVAIYYSDTLREWLSELL